MSSLNQTIVGLVILGLGLQVSSTCFTVEGQCQDGKTAYNDGDIWTPLSYPCHSCICITEKRTVTTCLEIEEKQPSVNQVKKSKKEYIIKEIERVISAEESISFKCPTNDLTSSTYSAITVVHYVTIDTFSSCCEIGMEPTNVHPLCKVKTVNQCEKEVVMRADESQPCHISYGMQ